ncbi:Uncharacterized protein TCM_021163 [Theobroma cacao]|uniref:Uncharacterized protein n=1 Tax=Theobroma cacao TaxID=3641 RepID=A0A061ENM5_THECC|nr:Uncharacterized protein TCM_021163 [Theobroma cacao]
MLPIVTGVSLKLHWNIIHELLRQWLPLYKELDKNLPVLSHQCEARECVEPTIASCMLKSMVWLLRQSENI